VVKPQLLHFGKSHSPVVVIDDFSGDLGPILAIAEELAPYPPHTSYYPGLRHIIDVSNGTANSYVEQTCATAAQFIGGAFEVDRFNLLEASFSMVTTAPAALSPPQRAPHFDTTDQNHLALLHYLRVPAESGTAFYRQRATGIERVSKSNLDRFVRTAMTDAGRLPPDSGYILGSNEYFEQIGAVEAVPDRMVIYQGSLLHSGIIPKEMSFSTDPREGRLTANIFVQGN
jgi:hypothetical protein